MSRRPHIVEPQIAPDESHKPAGGRCGFRRPCCGRARTPALSQMSVTAGPSVRRWSRGWIADDERFGIADEPWQAGIGDGKGRS
jgi:hypothetical protein